MVGECVERINRINGELKQRKECVMGTLIEMMEAVNQT